MALILCFHRCSSAFEKLYINLPDAFHISSGLDHDEGKALYQLLILTLIPSLAHICFLNQRWLRSFHQKSITSLTFGVKWSQPLTGTANKSQLHQRIGRHFEQKPMLGSSDGERDLLPLCSYLCLRTSCQKTNGAGKNEAKLSALPRSPDSWPPPGVTRNYLSFLVIFLTTQLYSASHTFTPLPCMCVISQAGLFKERRWWYLCHLRLLFPTWEIVPLIILSTDTACRSDIIIRNSGAVVAILHLNYPPSLFLLLLSEGLCQW